MFQPQTSTPPKRHLQFETDAFEGQSLASPSIVETGALRAHHGTASDHGIDELGAIWRTCPGKSGLNFWCFFRLLSMAFVFDFWSKRWSKIQPFCLKLVAGKSRRYYHAGGHAACRAICQPGSHRGAEKTGRCSKKFWTSARHVLLILYILVINFYYVIYRYCNYIFCWPLQIIHDSVHVSRDSPSFL